MTKQQNKQLKDVLIEFVTRVAKGNATSDAEINILPEVAGVLESVTLTKKQHKQASEAIFEFIIRVAKGNANSDAEIMILPKMLS